MIINIDCQRDKLQGQVEGKSLAISLRESVFKLTEVKSPPLYQHGTMVWSPGPYTKEKGN